MAKYLVMNIGCLECGVSSGIVGIFSSLARATEVSSQCDNLHNWRDGGHHEYEIFELPPEEQVNEEYAGVK